MAGLSTDPRVTTWQEKNMSKHVELNTSNPGAVHREVRASEELAEIVGRCSMARDEVTSRPPGIISARISSSRKITDAKSSRKKTSR